MRQRDAAYGAKGAPLPGGAGVGPDKPEDESKLGPMRIQLAKEELVRVVKDLAPSQEFAIVFFAGGPEAWPEDGKLRKATPATKEEAVAAIEEWSTSLGTDIYGALETALAYERSTRLKPPTALTWIRRSRSPRPSSRW